MDDYLEKLPDFDEGERPRFEREAQVTLGLRRPPAPPTQAEIRGVYLQSTPPQFDAFQQRLGVDQQMTDDFQKSITLRDAQAAVADFRRRFMRAPAFLQRPAPASGLRQHVNGAIPAPGAERPEDAPDIYGVRG